MFTNTSFSSLVHKDSLYLFWADFAKKDTSYKGVLVKKTQSNGGSVRMLVGREDVFLLRG